MQPSPAGNGYINGEHNVPSPRQQQRTIKQLQQHLPHMQHQPPSPMQSQQQHMQSQQPSLMQQQQMLQQRQQPSPTRLRTIQPPPNVQQSNAQSMSPQQLPQRQQQDAQQCSCFGVKPSPQTTEPYLRIVEEPQHTGLRFRYQCEGKSAGSIMGASSEGERKTYPEIKIENHSSSAIIVVSCVTRDHPHKPHPHQLVGPSCNDGIFTQRLSNGQTSCVLQNIGIQCCKRSDVRKNLNKRKESRVDPFGTGISDDNIDPCVVRLCFQAFLPDAYSRKFTRILYPVVSQPILDKKAMKELIICRMSESSCSVSGGKEIFLLCEKVNKDDIMVRFFETDKDGNTVWDGFGKFSSDDVHRQLAIVFKTPEYKHLNITHTVDVFVQLVRPSDGATSEAKPFHYYPQDADPYGIERKRQKLTRDGATSGFSADMQKHMAWLKNLNKAGSGNIGAIGGDFNSARQGNATIIPDFAALTSQGPSIKQPRRSAAPTSATLSAAGQPAFVPVSLPKYTLENLSDTSVGISTVTMSTVPLNMDEGSQSNDVKPFTDASSNHLQFQELDQLLQQRQQLGQQLHQTLPQHTQLLAEPSTIDFADIFDSPDTFVDMLDLSPTLLSLAENSTNQIPSFNFDELNSGNMDSADPSTSARNQGL